jgi:uncharacterized protein (TIGR02246 family)
VSSNQSSAVDEIRELIKQLNDAWVKGQPGELARFFPEDIVMALPGFAQRIEGRDACVASYEDFCSQASILDLKLAEPMIDVFGDTAVAAYAFEISYEMGGERFKDSGRDLFVFIRQDDRWQAVWRTMIVPQEEKVN